MTPQDTRQVVGSSVHATKAMYVTNKAECACHYYGTKLNSKMLLGTVVNVASLVTMRGRTTTYLHNM
jgi:hypothetical protein